MNTTTAPDLAAHLPCTLDDCAFTCIAESGGFTVTRRDDDGGCLCSHHGDIVWRTRVYAKAAAANRYERAAALGDCGSTFAERQAAWTQLRAAFGDEAERIAEQIRKAVRS